MTQRGRRSAASFETNVVTLHQRPKPPAELTADQAVEWKAIVDRMPADWFPRETHALLVQLCRHVVAARDIERRIRAAKRVKDLNLLLSMQDRERRAIESLSRSMRLSPRSRYSKDKKTGPSAPRPWAQMSPGTTQVASHDLTHNAARAPGGAPPVGSLVSPAPRMAHHREETTQCSEE
jgi:hypothetical protein